MSYRYTDENGDQYYRDGFTILRGLIPASLLIDLRLETDKARQIARAKDGPQTQRLQPVYAYEELNHQPFRDFLDLPELVKTVENVLSPEHTQSDIMGVLLEPAEKPWAMNWHRDWAHHSEAAVKHGFWDAMRNPLMFNQLNAALWDDHSLWVVPGSHNREDTPQEEGAYGSIPAPHPALTDDLSDSEREIVCSEYVRKMPGGQPVALLAGDCAFYRACQWHVGAYIPYTKRATLHDGFYGPDDRAWQAAVRAGQ
ncbi:MAG TPA: phytanoyl-CoA dioxygenase family protein [Fimbriimonas sp.]|nr:phytanoyl-CoA dioxygenase family protein [Fimbriimonas sp.]